MLLKLLLSSKHLKYFAKMLMLHNIIEGDRNPPPPHPSEMLSNKDEPMPEGSDDDSDSGEEVCP